MEALKIYEEDLNRKNEEITDSGNRFWALMTQAMEKLRQEEEELKR